MSERLTLVEEVALLRAAVERAWDDLICPGCDEGVPDHDCPWGQLAPFIKDPFARPAPVKKEKKDPSVTAEGK